jgi:predicted RNA-binding Zn-ribbon protein involved in translation (DUF1610 family)
MMSLDATCPHCGEEFNVEEEDCNESGPYACPECNKEIWIEVEYFATYEATCMPQDHQWVQWDNDKDWQKCEKCRDVRHKSRAEKAGD